MKLHGVRKFRKRPCSLLSKKNWENSLKTGLNLLKKRQSLVARMCSVAISSVQRTGIRSTLCLQDAHITTELEFQDAKVQLQEAHQSLADLKEKYSALLEQLHQRTDSKITPLKKIKH